MLNKISVVTIAKNEEVNIAARINSSKGWASEHIVDVCGTSYRIFCTYTAKMA